jgi:hypothetical protein
MAGRWARIAPPLHACIPKHQPKIRTVADRLQANSWARDMQGILGIQEGRDW